MSPFDEAAHPRSRDGKFDTKVAAEADVDLDVDFSAGHDGEPSAATDLEADEKVARHLLSNTVYDTIDRITSWDGPAHPDLVAIVEDLRALTRTGPRTSQETLTALAAVDSRLTGFIDQARAAYAAHDEWVAQGRHGDDPAAAYDHGDSARAREARDTLHEGRSAATGQVYETDFAMYSPEADKAVRAEMDLLAARIDAGALYPAEMPKAIRAHVKGLAARFPEVHDTEPECAIVNTLNRC